MGSGSAKYNFVVTIAGHRFGICSSAEEARRTFEGFITEDGGAKPEMIVRISPEEARRRTAQGIRGPWEQLRLDCISRYLLTQEVLHIHASAVQYLGRAWLFTAPSGGGKSTHAALWRHILGDKAVMINDDKPYLRFEKDNITVCGSPWMGRHRLGANLEAPLGGICHLRKDSRNEIRRMTPDEAFFLLAGQIYIWDDEEDTRHIFRLMDRMVREIPVFDLSCNMTAEAAVTSIRAMTGTEPGAEAEVPSASGEGL